MLRLRKAIEQMNAEVYNPVGLNVLWPENVAFLYVRGTQAMLVLSNCFYYSWRSSIIDRWRPEGACLRWARRARK